MDLIPIFSKFSILIKILQYNMSHRNTKRKRIQNRKIDLKSLYHNNLSQYL